MIASSPLGRMQRNPVIGNTDPLTKSILQHLANFLPKFRLYTYVYPIGILMENGNKFCSLFLCYLIPFNVSRHSYTPRELLLLARQSFG